MSDKKTNKEYKVSSIQPDSINLKNLPPILLLKPKFKEGEVKTVVKALSKEKPHVKSVIKNFLCKPFLTFSGQLVG